MLELLTSGDVSKIRETEAKMNHTLNLIQDSVDQREESVFALLRGAESDEHIREALNRHKAGNLEWLVNQFRQDPKIYEFTKSGYTFKPEELL